MPHENVSPEETLHPPRPAALSRRTLLKVTAGLGALPLFSLPLMATAAGESRVAADTAERFMRLSRQLTTRADLSAELGKRLQAALVSHYPAFDEHLAQLAQALDTEPVELTSEQRQWANRVLAAWYTGVVGDGDDVELITYEHALMFDAVSDVLVIRTYCPGKPGFWATPPPAITPRDDATTAQGA